MVYCKKCNKFKLLNEGHMNQMTCGECKEDLTYYCDECFIKEYGEQEVCSCIACDTPPMEFMKAQRTWRAPTDMTVYIVPLVCIVSIIAFLARASAEGYQRIRSLSNHANDLYQFMLAAFSLLSFPLSALVIHDTKQKNAVQYSLCLYYALCAVADVVIVVYFHLQVYNVPVLPYAYLVPLLFWIGVGVRWMCREVDFSLRKTVVHHRPCTEKLKKNS